MENIKSVPSKKVICVDGSIGTYVRETSIGHLILIRNPGWPFPENVYLKRDQFEYYNVKQSMSEEEYGTALF
ncbi:hypothetical protein EB118_19520 [bacterium]|nr:hypothetical protein [bacterium]